jgi:hypothetical protein
MFLTCLLNDLHLCETLGGFLFEIDLSDYMLELSFFDLHQDQLISSLQIDQYSLDPHLIFESDDHKVWIGDFHHPR